jgi:DNA-binding response OmpR family regulator
LAKILLVEDERHIADALKEWFATEGHVFEWVDNGEDALQLLKGFTYDIILLDWMLPGITGLQVCKEYRNQGGTSKIIFLTGQGDINSKEQGLTLGAEDYLVKPFDTRELSARIRAVLRRPSDIYETNLLTVGAVTLNPSSRTVTSKDKSVHLMPKEALVLEFLMRHPNKTFGSADLRKAVWPNEEEMAITTVRSWIRNLRTKLASAGLEDFVKTEPNAGYMVQE